MTKKEHQTQQIINIIETIGPVVVIAGVAAVNAATGKIKAVKAAKLEARLSGRDKAVTVTAWRVVVEEEK
jgi:hypothetical protein